jgi:hypothetical protein
MRVARESSGRARLSCSGRQISFETPDARGLKWGDEDAFGIGRPSISLAVLVGDLARFMLSPSKLTSAPRKRRRIGRRRLAFHRVRQANAERLLRGSSTAACATSFSTRACSSTSIMSARKLQRLHRRRINVPQLVMAYRNLTSRAKSDPMGLDFTSTMLF